MPEFDVGRVLVTGGAGFIGCALSRQAAAGAERWVAFDNLSPRIHQPRRRPDALASEAELVIADVCDASAWSRVIDDVRPNVIVHLAADTDTGLSLTNASRFAHVNVTGTAVMLDALTAADHRPDRIILASTRAVYGEGRWEDTTSHVVTPRLQRSHEQLARGEWDFPGASPVASSVDQTAPRPTNIYGVTKLAQEGLLEAWCGANGIDLAIMRLQNVYGPGQSLINPYTGILALFTRVAAAGGQIEVYEDGAMLRDFIHVEDVARAIAALLQRNAAHSGTFDVGTGVPASVLEVATTISANASAPPPVVTGAFREGDVRHAWCDPTPTMDAIGWQPAIDWNTGITMYGDWYRTHAEEFSR